MDLNWVPVDACTLPTVDQPVRLAEFDALFAAHGTSVAVSNDLRARLTFEGPTGLRDMVQDLASREASCCSFFVFTVSARADSDHEIVHLDVEVPQSHAAILAALVARARERARGD